MCIALISTAHPSYPLILIDNRDEFLNRPTETAKWWPEPDSHVLGGRDMLRDIHGTWLGVTKNGKIAVLTNYREDTTPPPSAISRGAIIRKFLAESVGPVEDFVKNVVNTGLAKDAGGFSLACGNIGEKLAVISNRAQDQSQVPWIAGDTVQTVGLSNAAFSDRSWKKVTLGEELMLNAIRDSVEKNETEDQLIQRFLDLLSYDTLPREGHDDDAGLEAYIPRLRDSIFVPTLGRKDMTGLTEDEMRTARKHEKIDIIGHNTPIRHHSPPNHVPTQAHPLGVSGLYGTQKQTIVLTDKDMNVRFFERTLFDEDSEPIPPGKGDIDVRFKIENM
ncbi:uncharacterized protein Z518_08172 [Rhinocladiella mackenziei CBS 650.93]|uniref:DUF833 domain-containing protein n=1 Tax=Rhinocladiella mackenziei CBS 650.93 TaxID=1442369 RepID=A0A0D2GVC3_9EURO|nr:uncharacterized protein Z518_08172 [Rhinocladiella mackenziei CBS 650.93]KIX02233.1 hypothetical protein Z518_08172 [Rhinocladiella mackenziei CBS 650.93]